MFRADNVVFANIAVEKCAFTSESEAQAIVEVSACDTERNSGLVALYHIAFRNNGLSGVSALRLTSPSCSELQMHDVEISDNVCSHEACGVLLGTKNRIEGIRLLRNILADYVDGFPSLLFASTSSRTVIKGLEAAENRLSVIQIRGGTLALSNASFDHNRLNTEKEAGNGTCVHLVQSTAEIAKSKFAENNGTWGSCLYAEESSFTVSSSEFVGNAADQGGGFSCVSDSTARFEQVEARNNIAKLDGGCVYAVNTKIAFTATTAKGNRAGKAGGCIFLRISNVTLSETNASKNSVGGNGGFLTMVKSMANLDRTTATENKATNGGAISLWASSNATLSRTTAVNNSATKYGGFVRVQNSSADLVDTTANGNSSGQAGGCIFAMHSNLTLSETNASKNSVGEDGGFLNMDKSTANLDRTTATENKATKGGAISLWASNATLSRTIAVNNSATKDGGFARVQNSTANLVDMNASSNNARTFGGCVRLVKSNVTLSETNASHNSAGRDGGFLNMDNSMLNVSRSTISEGRAASSGGLLATAAHSTVYVEYSMLKYGRSKNGGAVWLNETRFTGKSLSIVQCEAESGGGIMGNNSSSLLCINCTFRGNVAKRGDGGAVSFEAIRNQSQTVQLLNCSVLNNRADLGGERL